jgi:Phage Terminase
MTSVLVGPRGLLLGSQRPRISSLPLADDWSQGEDALELARQAGLLLDDWQRYVLKNALATRGGKWAAFEVGLIVSRQNGKGSIVEALELAALFLFDDVQLILHSAHKFDTAADAFRRILTLIEQNPDFSREVLKVIRSHGSESIELRNGKRLRFIARSAGAGRGFAADLVILDEAFNISDDSMASMLPTLSTRPNPQVWYTSTAGKPISVQLGRIRERGIQGDDPSLAFMEWSVDGACYDAADPACWVQANPGLGIRITPDYIELERAALSPDAFARERLGVGVYPADLAEARQKISPAVWASYADASSVISGPLAFGLSVGRSGASASIAVAGRRSDGLGHGELIDPPQMGTGWVIPRLIELRERHNPCVLTMNPAGAAGAFQRELEEHGFRTKPGPGECQLQVTGMREYAQACGALAQDVSNGRWRHLGQDPLDWAVASVSIRELADAWAWSWKDSAADISPLEAVTLARHGFMTFGVKAVPEPEIF